MASLDEGGDEGKKGPGVKKAKKLSTRIDMTPMVDLGFLLITFFIFTAAMTEPKAMNLNMPKEPEKEEDEMLTKESGALTIMLGKDNSIYYYEGKLADDASNFQKSTPAQIREVIIKKKKSVVSRYVKNEACEQKAIADKKDPRNCSQEGFFVIIKPTADATYQNAVDMLDEMTINEVSTFAVVKIMESEKKLVEVSDQSK